jgi:hypothetical protein
MEIMLKKIPVNDKFYYLQELIVNNLIEKIRKNYSVDSNAINEIRNYIVSCNWKIGEYFFQLFDAGEFYNFFVKNIGFGDISYEILSSVDNSVVKLNTFIISLDIDKMTDECSVHELLNTWISKKLVKYSDDKKKIKSYQFVDIPELVTLYINRNLGSHFNNKQIDIMKAIRFNEINEPQHELRWQIFSIVCLSESFPQHYYSVIKICESKDDVNWYIIDDTMIPSIFEIDIKNDDYSNKIKSECSLIFYTKSS